MSQLCQLFITILGVYGTHGPLGDEASTALQQWKLDAETHISRIQALALPTAFTPISVSIPKPFREWIPINKAAEASVHTGEGPRPKAPEGEVPLFVQLQKIKVRGLSISEAGPAAMWSNERRVKGARNRLQPHWWFRELLTLDKLNAELRLRVGNGRGLSPIFDIEVEIKDATVPFNIHALQDTQIHSNPSSRGQEFKVGRMTLESRNLPLPRRLQRKLSKSFTAELGGPVVGDIPLHIFGLPNLTEK